MPAEDSIYGGQDRSIVEALERDEPRLRRFIRSRVLDTEDVEDILQDIFFELVEAYRLLMDVQR